MTPKVFRRRNQRILGAGRTNASMGRLHSRQGDVFPIEPEAHPRPVASMNDPGGTWIAAIMLVNFVLAGSLCAGGSTGGCQIRRVPGPFGTAQTVWRQWHGGMRLDPLGRDPCKHFRCRVACRPGAVLDKRPRSSTDEAGKPHGARFSARTSGVTCTGHAPCRRASRYYYVWIHSFRCRDSHGANNNRDTHCPYSDWDSGGSEARLIYTMININI